MPWVLNPEPIDPTPPGRGIVRHPLGAWWFAPWLREERVLILSREFLSGPAKERDPIMMVFPGYFEFSPDRAPLKVNGKPYARGWTATGDPRLGTFSVRPVLRLPTYHGTITNNMISDDIDGRDYTLWGDLVRWR